MGSKGRGRKWGGGGGGAVGDWFLHYFLWSPNATKEAEVLLLIQVRKHVSGRQRTERVSEGELLLLCLASTADVNGVPCDACSIGSRPLLCPASI